MPDRHRIVEETKRTWYGRKYKVYVLYDNLGNIVTHGKERHKVEMVLQIIEDSLK